MTDSGLQLIEVELKFVIEDKALLFDRLNALEAVPQPIENHQDLYFRHPSRDFAKTREALRIRRLLVTRMEDNGDTAIKQQARVTYKGTPLSDGIKARHELEWELQPSDPQGDNLQELLIRLGFEPVMTVVKERRPMLLLMQGREVTVAIDEVQNVGSYVEVEVIAVGEADVAAARAAVEKVAVELGLSKPESRSYLAMLLGNAGKTTHFEPASLLLK